MRAVRLLGTMRILSAERLARAATFLEQQARPLERARFHRHFSRTAEGPLLQELTKFQNPDGGFAGLDPDFQIRESSVLSTTAALQIIYEDGLPVQSPTVEAALNYLKGQYDPALASWPLIPAHDNTAPHAPWWHFHEGYAVQWEFFQDNPRPEVLGYFYLRPDLSAASWRQHLLDLCFSRLQSRAPTKLEMHGLMAYTRLVENTYVPTSIRERLGLYLRPFADTLVERDPVKWSGYGLRPLDVVRSPESPLHRALKEVVDTQLDYLVEHQEADGSWAPTWNWGGNFRETWPAAEKAWRGLLTLRHLLLLRAFGRLPQ